MKKISIEITSSPDREKLVAEIWLEDQMIAEINQESDYFEVEIYTDERRKLTLNYDEFIEVLKEAREKLTH